jgi:hypothetical protein
MFKKINDYATFLATSTCKKREPCVLSRGRVADPEMYLGFKITLSFLKRSIKTSSKIFVFAFKFISLEEQ